MAKKLGNNYRLFVDSSTPGTFSEPKGQGNLTIQRGQNFFSTGTKDTTPYDTQAPGLKSLSLSLALIPDLPDANGYTRMETLDKTTATTTYQIRKGPGFAAPADVVFECSMYTSLGNTDLPQNGAVGVATTLTAAAAPTIDTLA